MRIVLNVQLAHEYYSHFHLSTIRDSTLMLFAFLYTFIYKERYDDGGKGEDYISDFVAVLHCLLVDIVSGLVVGVMIDCPSDACQDCVPHTGTESGVGEELAQVHSGKSCRNAYQLAHCRHKSAEEC